MSIDVLGNNSTFVSWTQLILLPELAVLVIGPMAAAAADYIHLSTWQRTACICFCQPLLVLAYLLLLLGSTRRSPELKDADSLSADLGSVPPSIPLGMLGASWGASHALFWGLLPTACPPQRLAIGSGLLGVALNVGPTLFPLALASLAPDDVARRQTEGSAGSIALRVLLQLSCCSMASCLALLAHSSARRKV